MPKAPSGCRKSGLRHCFEGVIAPLRLRRGQGAMQGNPWSARLFSHLPRTPRGGLLPGCPPHPRSQPGVQGRVPGRAGGRRRLAAGGLWPPACQTKWLGRGQRPSPQPFAGASRPAAAPPAGQPPNAYAGRRRRAGVMRCRSPHSSGQTYLPLPLVFSPYWMAWTGQRLMQLVQR